MPTTAATPQATPKNWRRLRLNLLGRYLRNDLVTIFNRNPAIVAAKAYSRKRSVSVCVSVS
jgi:hypothetical protein